jgi:hypothetical protein
LIEWGEIYVLILTETGQDIGLCSSRINLERPCRCFSLACGLVSMIGDSEMYIQAFLLFPCQLFPRHDSNSSTTIWIWSLSLLCCHLFLWIIPYSDPIKVDFF